MSFTIEELIFEIMHSSLTEGQRIKLLAKIYKTGQLNNRLFLIKKDGEDSLECWRRFIVDGKVNHEPTNYTAEETISAYTSMIPERPKEK